MIIESDFKAAWWLANTHLQTIWSSAFRRTSKLETTNQRLELSDGDFIDLEWLYVDEKKPNAPILLLLHGLEGSIDSSYIQGLLSVSQSESWRTLVMHFRGCSKESNRLPRSYHSGETEDLQAVLEHLKKGYPDSKIMVAGFSLGGNVLLKYLGESQSASLIDHAVAVSVPLLLAECSKRLDKGLSKLYRYRLLKELKRKFLKKYNLYSEKISISKAELSALNTFYDFDDKVTAPLHDFEGAEDYYSRSSSRQFLINIVTPTLIIQAKDDPFMTEKVIPLEDELSANVTMELSEGGGHVGFVSGHSPWQIVYYLDKKIPAWFTKELTKN